MTTPTPQPPALSPLYTPPTEDTQIVIRFVGNTSRVVGFGWKGELDPFQLWAAARWLQRKADEMQAASEAKATARAAAGGIQTPMGLTLPPGVGLPGT